MGACRCVSIAPSMGGFQLEFVSISRVINHMTIIRVLSLVEITAFRLESKSFKGFFLK